MLVAMAKSYPISSSRAGLSSVVVTDPRGFVANVGVVAGPPDQPATGLLFTDADVILPPAIAAPGAQALSPALVDDAETLYGILVTPGSVTLVAPLYTDAETIYSVPSITADAPGHGLQRLRPDAIGDAEAIYAAAIGASLKPSLVPSDDIVPAIPSVAAARGSAFIPADDAVYPLTITLFVQPQRVVDVDAIPAADVGWQVIASFTTDADAVYAAHDVFAYNDVLPEVLAEDDVIDTYPFFVQGVTGGIPVPRPPGVLTGSLRPPLKVLTGSIKRQVRLTGSLNTPPRLTGSIGNARRNVGPPKTRKH